MLQARVLSIVSFYKDVLFVLSVLDEAPDQVSTSAEQQLCKMCLDHEIMLISMGHRDSQSQGIAQTECC